MSSLGPSLTVEEFRRILGYNPFHFWGMTNATVPVTSACNGVVKQHAWQSEDAAGRDNILEAIRVAEDRIREHLGFYPGPRYIEDTLNWPKYLDQNLWRFSNSDPSGRFIGTKLDDRYVQEIGTEQLTLVGNAAVTSTDADSDGLKDTFQISIATTETDPTHIAVYFTAADRLDGEGVGDAWRIRPVRVSIAAGVATITGRYWLIVKPIKYEGVGYGNDLDPATSANFASTLDVYQRATYTGGTTVDTAQAVLLWESSPCHSWFCLCSACSGVAYTPASSDYDPAAVGMAIARVGIRDSVNGLVVPALSVLNSSTGIWSAISWNSYREPDRVKIRYLAGYPPAANGEVNHTFQTVVARLAAAELGRRIAACDEASQELYHWQFDLARSGGANDESYQVSPEDLANPLGTRRGHVYAWKQLKHLRVLDGVAF